MSSAVVKATHLEDLGVYITKLPGRGYVIDGKPFKNTPHEEIQLTNIDDVRPASHIEKITEYTDGNQKISTDGYYLQLERLKEKATTVDGTEIPTFDDVEDRVAYLRYTDKWKPVRKRILVIDDPLLFDVTSGKVDTGNKFIFSLYTVDGGPCNIYVYKRGEAVKYIVREVFENLNMVFAGDVHYKQTADNPVWGCSNFNNGIEFVTAFGTYVFPSSSEYRNVSKTTRGTLDKLQAQFEEDYENIKRIIHSKYALHKQSFDSSVFSFDTTITCLQQIHAKLSELPVKNKGHDEWVRIMNKVVDEKKRIQNWLSSQIDTDKE